MDLSILYFKGPQVQISKFYSISVPEDCFYLSKLNSAEIDEMLHYAAFHLGLHCLPKYLSNGIQNEIGNSKRSKISFLQ